MKKSKLLLVFWLFSCAVWAQDSIRVLNSEQVLLLVKKYHPIARQAQIEVKQADAGVRIARGAFNPILNGYLAQKNFDGTPYYDVGAAEVVIPTWYGIELSGGIQQLNGDRLNNSETSGKTNFAGVSVPLAQNLIIDKRRAFLKQAKLYQTMAKAEQRAMMNDLLMGAMEHYWQWVYAYQTYSIMNNNVQVNELRLELIRKSLKNGERAAIDTVEALTQLQSFQYSRNQFWLQFQQAGLELSAYLWKSNDEPFYLPENVIPQAGWENETNLAQFNLALPDLLSTAQKNNPTLVQYNTKVDMMQIDQRLKFQLLLPKVDLQYQHLGKTYTFRPDGLVGNDNYQYGLKFQMPLLLSEGRGAYQKARLMTEVSKLDLNMKQQQVEIKIRQYFNEYLTLKKQVELQSLAYQNYLSLLKAEEQKLANGESSLFLVNSRETKALEAQEKLIAIKTKYFKTLYALQWSAGILE